jgi:hypothetical protein
MKSITIHNLDESLEYMIREKAKKQGTSLNKTIQMLLKQSLGINSKSHENHKEDFLAFFGVWSENDEKEFKKNIHSFNEINEADWK